MEPPVARGSIARTVVDFRQGPSSAGRKPYHRAGSVAIAFDPFQPESNEVASPTNIHVMVKGRGEIVAVVQNVHPAVVVEVADGQAAGHPLLGEVAQIFNLIAEDAVACVLVQKLSLSI